MIIDKTAKILLAIIALGIWGNIIVSSIKPAMANNESYLSQISGHLSSINSNLISISSSISQINSKTH